MTDDELHSPEGSALPFAVELWGADGKTVERVLARVNSANVARAVFKACEEEFPGRLLTLRKGDQELARTAK